MIVNGSSNRCVWWWSRHLQSEVNDKVEIVESYGLRSNGSIEAMLQEMTDLAHGTRCRNAFYQMNMSAAPGEHLTLDDWDRARRIAEKAHGLEGQPYFMVMHTKHGEQHPHFIYSRIDLESMRAISDSNDARKNHAIAREIEQQLGLQKVLGPYDREPETPRPERAPQRWEMYRAMQSGLSIPDIEAEVAELRQSCTTGQEFQDALDRHGYILARGDRIVAGRPALMIVDIAGDEHSLARRLHMKTKELNVFMADIDCAALPDIRQAQTMHSDRKLAALEADRATVKHEIAWEEALASAAIEKEKHEKRFVADEDKETRVGQQKGGGREKEKEPEKKAEPGLNKTAAIQLAYALTDGPEQFLEAIRESQLHAARVTAQDIHDRDSRTPEPEKRGENKKQRREISEYACAGDVVILDAWGNVYELNRHTTGDTRRNAQAALAGADKNLPSIEDARREQQEQRQQWKPSMPERPLNETQGKIRMALNLSPSAQGFAEALKDHGMTLAQATTEDERLSLEREQFVATAKALPGDKLSPFMRRQLRHLEYQPRIRHGDYVAVTDEGRMIRLTPHVTGRSKAELEKFMATLDPRSLPGVDAAVKANTPAYTREPFARISPTLLELFLRDPSAPLREAGGIAAATGRTIARDIETGAGQFASSGLKATRQIGSIFGALGRMLFGGTRPETPRQEAARVERENAQEESHIDFARYTADRVMEQQQLESERAERERQRQSQYERDR